MLRIRSGWIVVVCAGLFAGTACKKDDAKKADPQTKAGDSPSDPKAVEKGDQGDSGGKLNATPSSTASADDLGLLPVDSEIVMGINFAQVQQSALWKQFVEPEMTKGDFLQKLGEFKSKCGFDPLVAVKSIAIGIKGIDPKGRSKPDGVLVLHGIEKSKAGPCIEKLKAEPDNDVEVTVDGDVTLFTSKDRETAATMFVNETTAIAVIGPNASKEGVIKAAAGGSPLKTSPAFISMYNKINANESMWMLINGNSKVVDQASALGLEPKGVFGSLNVTDGLTLDMRVRLDSAAKAADFANKIKSQATMMAAQFVDKLDITSDGQDVRIAVAVSNTKLMSLIQKFAGRGMGGP